MTKRAVIVGLIMAAIVLFIIFVIYKPRSESNTIYEQESVNNNQPSSASDNTEESTADLEADLNAIGSDLTNIRTDLDTSGL